MSKRNIRTVIILFPISDERCNVCGYDIVFRRQGNKVGALCRDCALVFFERHSPSLFFAKAKMAKL